MDFFFRTVLKDYHLPKNPSLYRYWGVLPVSPVDPGVIWVHGRSLPDWCHMGPWTIPTRLPLLIQILDIFYVRLGGLPLRNDTPTHPTPPQFLDQILNSTSMRTDQITYNNNYHNNIKRRRSRSVVVRLVTPLFQRRTGT